MRSLMITEKRLLTVSPRFFSLYYFNKQNITKMNNINLLKKILLEKYIDTSELNSIQLESFLLFFKNEIGVEINSLVNYHGINKLENMNIYIYQKDNYLRYSSRSIEDLEKDKKHFLSINSFWILTKLRNENCDLKELYYKLKENL